MEHVGSLFIAEIGVANDAVDFTGTALLQQ
jgi:hypothetical protein